MTGDDLVLVVISSGITSLVRRRADSRECDDESVLAEEVEIRIGESEGGRAGDDTWKGLRVVVDDGEEASGDRLSSEYPSLG